MRKISKFLAVLIILVMFATLAVSCKKSGDEDLDGSINGAQSGEGTEQSGDSTQQSGDKTEQSGNKTNSGTGEKITNDSGVSNNGVETNESTSEIKDGGIVETESGAIVETNTNQTVDENFHINEAVTNDNGFIPDEEQGLEKSERRATEASKYNFDENPLINRDRQHNTEILPSFDLNDTGFVRAGTKIEDLKGKTIYFYSADDYAAWSYRDKKGQTIDEWTWFKQLKSEIGLSVKMTVTGGWNETVEKSLKDMNAGKQCDVIPTSHVTFPSSLCISRSITELVNINDIGSSPGICKRTMDICKWGNTYRLIAPIGVVDVLWYNATLAQELGLSDPHKMWEADKWDWASFKSFQLSIPAKTQDGKELISMGHWVGNTSYIWPSTTGTSHIYIDADAPVPTLVNNWDAASTMRAWEFITGIANTTNYSPKADAYNNLFLGTSMMAGTMYTQVYKDTEYSKHVQINWVPYPMENARSFSEMQAVVDAKYATSDIKATATHDGIAQFSGFAMLLPKKTIKENNVDYALKFMELWATRFTETYFDNLNVFEYFNFNYKQRKQYFDFVTQNVVFGLAMNDFYGSDFRNDMGFYRSFEGDPAYNIKTEATKNSNIVAAYIVESLKYGQ